MGSDLHHLNSSDSMMTTQFFFFFFFSWSDLIMVSMSLKIPKKISDLVQHQLWSPSVGEWKKKKRWFLMKRWIYITGQPFISDFPAHAFKYGIAITVIFLTNWSFMYMSSCCTTIILLGGFVTRVWMFLIAEYVWEMQSDFRLKSRINSISRSVFGEKKAQCLANW